MTQELILQGFENLIQNLSYGLRYENGDFIGGLCKFRNHGVFIINKSLPVDRKITLIAEELKRINLERVYIRPALREIIEKSKQGDNHSWRDKV